MSIECSDCEHTWLECGVQVACCRSGLLTDQRLDDLRDGELRFGGLRLRNNRDSVHRLPAGFPERRDTRLSDVARREIAAAYGCPEESSGHRLSAASAHPVVVAGEPSAFLADVDLMFPACTSPGVRGRLLAGKHLRDWFRYPVLVMNAIPRFDDEPWVSALRPRLVVIAGSAAWVASSRSNWPEVPILALLSRRSPAAAEVASLLTTSGWAAPSQLPSPLRQLLRPQAGLEMLCATEPDATHADEDLW